MRWSARTVACSSLDLLVVVRRMVREQSMSMVVSMVSCFS